MLPAFLCKLDFKILSMVPLIQPDGKRIIQNTLGEMRKQVKMIL